MGAAKTGIRLFIITVIAAAVIAIVNTVTAPVISRLAHSERESAMAGVLTDITDPEFSELITTDNTYGVISYCFAYTNDELAGYVLNARCKGDQGDIELCIGLDKDSVVLGARMTAHEETPGIGANAARQSFLSQFTGRSGSFNIVKTHASRTNDIVAVTAATNTSRAVVNAVNDAVLFCNTNLRGR